MEQGEANDRAERRKENLIGIYVNVKIYSQIYRYERTIRRTFSLTVIQMTQIARI